MRCLYHTDNGNGNFSECVCGNGNHYNFMKGSASIFNGRQYIHTYYAEGKHNQ